MKKYTYAELDAMPTLGSSQADDCKISKPGLRVWISRCGVADGETCDQKVTVETWDGVAWVEEWYPG